MKSGVWLVSLVIAILSCSLEGCRARQLSGTYCAHDARAANMLQLTQTASGQITGVFSVIELGRNNKVRASQETVEGTSDSGQITLSFGNGPAWLGVKTLSGTANPYAVSLQTVDSNGTVSPYTLSRCSATDFKGYADGLKAEANTLAINSNLKKQTEKIEATVNAAGSWISDAEVHIGRIPAVKNRYQEIEEKMKRLLRQQMISEGLARAQIALAISQYDAMATQQDNNVEITWNQIISKGATISDTIPALISNCKAADDELLRSGLPRPLLEDWHNACHSLQDERSRFAAECARIDQLSSALNSFKTEGQQRRLVIIDRSNRSE